MDLTELGEMDVVCIGMAAGTSGKKVLVGRIHGSMDVLPDTCMGKPYLTLEAPPGFHLTEGDIEELKKHIPVMFYKTEAEAITAARKAVGADESG